MWRNRGQRRTRALHAEQDSHPGEKIRISGGGRCNFTNLHNQPRDEFSSANPRFATPR